MTRNSIPKDPYSSKNLISILFLLIFFSFIPLLSAQTQCTQQSCDDGNPCTTDLCDSFGACRHFQKAPNTSCDDGIFCNGEDKCQAGVCVHSGNPCPSSSLSTVCFSTCTEGTNGKNGTCNAPNGTRCDDLKFCTKNDFCDGSGLCIGKDSPCGRSNPCNNTCSETLKSCNVPNGRNCTSSKFCDGVGTCFAGTCTNYTSPCLGNSECNNMCNETNRNCISPQGTICSSPLDISCSFGRCSGSGICNVLFQPPGTSCFVNNCTQGAVCSDTSCVFGSHTCECQLDTDCDDKNPCTIDSCGLGGVCIYTNATEGSFCDDGIYCNGNDTCNASGVCANHSGDPCELNSFCNNTCNENLKHCHQVDFTPCPDNKFCNGFETCQNGVCTSPGDPCLGGDPCNSTCSESPRSDGSGSCLSPVGTSCEDGLWCNGAEMCDGFGICQNGTDPCLGGFECNQTCQEMERSCFAPDFTPCNGGLRCDFLDATCESGSCFVHSSSNCTPIDPGTGPIRPSSSNTFILPTSPNSIDSSSPLIPIIAGSVGGSVLIAAGIIAGIIIALKRKKSKDRQLNAIERGDLNPFFPNGSFNSPDISHFSPHPHSPSMRPTSIGTMNPSFFLSSPSLNILLSPNGSPRKSENRAISPEGWQNGGSHNQYGAKVTQAELEANVKGMEEVEIIKLLGAGNFGEVFMGVWHKPENNGIVIDIEVALKKLKVREQFHEFCHEAATLQSMLHPHIVRYYGIFIDHSNGDSFIATEYMRMGSLLELLQNDTTNSISEAQMLEMALGAAIGMTYLETCKIVHRDLSCRNLLVSMDGRGHYIVKVSDFGMSKCLEQNYYVASDSLIPVRWSAIEVLKYKRFSHKSDVWSFGILMWEIIEKGREPYTHMSNKQVVNAILSGERLEKPKECPEDIYDLMTLCWKEDPAARPTFEEILTLLWKATEKRESSGKTEDVLYLRDSSVVHETYEQTDSRVRRASNADEFTGTHSGRSFLGYASNSFKDDKYAHMAKEIHNNATSEGFSDKSDSETEQEMHEISLENTSVEPQGNE